jgi:hypothetical protein
MNEPLKKGDFNATDSSDYKRIFEFCGLFMMKK